MRAAVGTLGLLLWAQPLPDSVPLAQPLWLAKASTSTPPQGPEVLAQRLSHDTFYAWVRFWEGPGPVQWRWGSDTYRTATFVPALPPDSLMPLADFSMPSFPVSAVETDSFAWEALWIGVGLLLVSIFLAPFVWRAIRPALRRIGLMLRWWLFLWRWRPRPKGDFLAFAQAVKMLLRAHANFHPGALTPQEAQAIQGNPALRDMLCQLLELEYALDFTGRQYSPEQVLAVWQAAWKALRQTAPTLRRTLPQLTL